MIFKQYFLGCLAHASYLIGDEETKLAAVIDPQRDIDQYLEDAAANGLRIRYVFLTHFHADFLAGHLELRERTGAEIYLGAQAQAEYPFFPMKDGDVLEFGKVRLKILETPGHTPEAISILLYDLVKDNRKPYAVFTGDTLFIGDVGRPDLMASQGVTAEELAGWLYESLHKKLLLLPDETLVYPAHGAGSMCGRHLSEERVSTIGVQRQYNYALQPMSRQAFVSLVTVNQPEAPQYFSYAAQLNRQGRPTLGHTMASALKPLSVEDVLHAQENGAQLLDVREAADFAGAHIPGSLNIGLGGKFATWAGTMLDQSDPIVLIADPGREQEAAIRLGRIGYDHVMGYLAGGMSALRNRPELSRQTSRITAGTLAELLMSRLPVFVLDVRTEAEWRAGHIDGSLNIPVTRLRDCLSELPQGRQIVVQCQSGYRSSIAAGLLEQRGFTNVVDLIGGYEAWAKTWNRRGKIATCSAGGSRSKQNRR
jgi:glyoxylase-like metal-dependent hydrolase (beta-lactamase superfamily II)/rhodanese-related sulfurtransferase